MVVVVARDLFWELDQFILFEVRFKLIVMTYWWLMSSRAHIYQKGSTDNLWGGDNKWMLLDGGEKQILL